MVLSPRLSRRRTEESIAVRWRVRGRENAGGGGRNETHIVLDGKLEDLPESVDGVSSAYRIVLSVANVIIRRE